MKIAKIMYHRWEEEPISSVENGKKGTFAIFFYGCNMRCVYCQNSKISRFHIGLKPLILTPDELSDKMLNAQNDGACTVSFITGVLYVEKIVETIILAKEKGLKIPIVYNTSSYEKVSQLKKLNGLIDIYLPDFKYFDNELGKLYSKVPDYADVARLAIDEMYQQVKNNCIVRHLVLPGHTKNAKSIIKYLYDKYGDGIFLSIMSQYTPMLNNDGIDGFLNLRRKLSKREYKKVVDFAIELGVKNAFIQEGDVADESFIPDF